MSGVFWVFTEPW